MSDKFDVSIVEPTSCPTDQDAARAIQDYLTWLRTDGSQGSELGGAFDFRGANLNGFQLKWKFLWGANFSGVVMDDADLYKSELVGAVLNRASLRGARLHRVVMSECEARGSVFLEANLLKARMSDSELVESDFRKTWTSGAHFDDADLRGADFRDARFGPEEPGGWTRFSGARMGGVNCLERKVV